MAKSVHHRKSTARSSKVRKSHRKTKKVVRRKRKSTSSKRKKRKTSKKRKTRGKKVMRGGDDYSPIDDLLTDITISDILSLFKEKIKDSSFRLYENEKNETDKSNISTLKLLIRAIKNQIRVKQAQQSYRMASSEKEIDAFLLLSEDTSKEDIDTFMNTDWSL